MTCKFCEEPCVGLYCDEMCYNLGWRSRPVVICQRRIMNTGKKDGELKSLSNRLTGRLNGGHTVRRLVSLY